jgi:hypothetical protein
MELDTFFQKTRVLSLNRITYGEPERGNLTQNKNSQYVQKLAFVRIGSFCFVGRAGFEPAKM